MRNRIKHPGGARSLAATLAIGFLALSVVTLLIASSLQIFSNFQTQQQAIATKQQLIAQQAASTVSNFIQEKFNVLDSAIRLADPASVAPSQQRQVLEGLLGLEPAFRQVVLLNAQDVQVADASRLSTAASGGVTDRLGSDLLAQIKQGKKYISAVYIDPVTSEPLVVMAVPITNVLGEVEGTLAAEVNLKFMWDLVDQLKVGQTGVAYVVDAQGNLIAFHDTARVLKGENVANLTDVAEFIRNPSSRDTGGTDLSTGILGASVTGSYVPLGTPDWAVMTELPWQEAYQDVIRDATTSLGITAVMAILASLVGAFVARQLAVPLISLTGTATRIAGGELELQAPVSGPNEIARLASAFNSMTQQLRGLISGLEQRVAERTAELVQSSEALRRQNEYLTALHDTTLGLMQRLDLEELLGAIINRAGALVGTANGYVFLLEPGQTEMEMRVGVGAYSGFVGSLAKRGSGLAGKVWESGQPVVVDDYRSWGGRLPDPRRDVLRAVVGVPLKSGNQVVGVIGVAHVEEGKKFGSAEIEVLDRFAELASVALDNVRLAEHTQTLLAETQRRAKREAQIATITDRIHATTEVKTILQIAAEELRRTTGGARAVIRLSREDSAASKEN